MSVSEIDIFVKKYRPLLFKSFRAPYPYCYRCPVKKKHPDCNLACIKVFEDTARRHHREIAACIIEPMLQGAAGMVVSPPGFLKKIERLCRKYNILLIADEVATGFGRTGKVFACEHERIRPDFLCLAKGLTGGYLPLAVTLTTEKVYRAFLGRYEDFRAFYHGHTYTGNQLGCAAAIANIDTFHKDNTIKKLSPKIRLLSSLLKDLKDLQHIGDIRQIGLIAGIELVKNKKTKSVYPPNKKIGHRVCMEARKDGLIIRPLGDVIALMPPLSITESELRRMVKTVYNCIRNITDG
jgi:adenosylmethionine-8-amino-7-oxononanoate aminotransferase